MKQRLYIQISKPPSSNSGNFKKKTRLETGVRLKVCNNKVEKRNLMVFLNKWKEKIKCRFSTLEVTKEIHPEGSQDV